MLNSSSRAEVRLTLLNVAVFSAVLLTFTAAVFLVVADSMRREMRFELERLADGVIASIDYTTENNKKPDHPQPEMISSVMPKSSNALLNDLRLQWFDPGGQLIVEKGTLAVSEPLQKERGFQEQKLPHAEIYTKPVYLNNAILGYIRVAQPLERLDRNMAGLASGLILGLVAAILVTTGGIFILVRQSLLPVQQSMKRLRQFVGDASHEFRSPIMAILTNSSVALKYPEAMRDGDREKFELIEKVAIQMRKLLEDLLLLAKAEEVPQPFEPVSLLAIVNDALDNIAWLIEKKQCQVVVNIGKELRVPINPDDLRRVILNLVENAIQYSKEGETVSLDAQLHGKHVTIRVKDTGVGIDANNLSKVFDRFWQADKVRSARDNHHGLGLSIVKALVEHHSGSVSVTSQLGLGTIFEVTLPASIDGNKSADIREIPTESHEAG